MTKSHKGLPADSQAWAAEVDALMIEVRELRGVVKRLTENAGIDMSNPRRGVNSGATPSVKNPVGQKLSSLADVSTYNVLDGQFLSWCQKGQTWLPASSVDGSIDVSAIAYGWLERGYGIITDENDYAYTAAYSSEEKGGYAEMWSSAETYIGAGSWQNGPLSLIHLTYDAFDRPYIELKADAFADGVGRLFIGHKQMEAIVESFVLPTCTTATRPALTGTPFDKAGASVIDKDLNKLITWDGAGNWRDALGTIV